MLLLLEILEVMFLEDLIAAEELLCLDTLFIIYQFDFQKRPNDLCLKITNQSIHQLFILNRFVPKNIFQLQKFDSSMETVQESSKPFPQNPSYLKTSPQALQKIVNGLNFHQLSGLQSSACEKFISKIRILSYEDATAIYSGIGTHYNLKQKKNWKNDEVSFLIYCVDKLCLKFNCQIEDLSQQVWEQIGQILCVRKGSSCRSKVFSLMPSNLNQKPWSIQEHQILSSIIQKEGINKWKTISSKLFQQNPFQIYRTSKQCRERYLCFLQPKLKKGFWQPQEDYQLITLFLKFGRKWSKMAKIIDGRNENAIKNRFFLLFDKSKNQRIYYSEFMRKVLRKKEKLEKQLTSQNSDCNSDSVCEQKTSIKKDEQFTDISKFLCL